MLRHKILAAALAIPLAAAPWFADSASAAPKAPISTPVNVQLMHHTTFGLNLNGFYELSNLDTGSKMLLTPSLISTVSYESGKVSIAGSGLTLSSVKGFTISELEGSGVQLVTFSSATEMKSGAADTYEVKYSFVKGEAAEYVDTLTTPAGETWYNVKNASGAVGWVKNTTAYAPKAAPSLSLFGVNSKRYRGNIDLTQSSSKVKLINRLDMEDYLKGVVPAEMPASWHAEALKVQAVASRSYAFKTNVLQPNTSSQMYLGYDKEDARSNAVIAATAGQYVKYNGSPIQAFFYSTSGGKTANVSDVWSSNQASYPYLVSVDSPGETSPYNNWTFTYSSSELLSNFGLSPSAALYSVSLVAPGANGEVRGAKLNTSLGLKEYSGSDYDMRKYFKNGTTLARSNWFTIDADKTYNMKTGSGTQSQFGIKGASVQTADGVVSVSTPTVSIQTASGTITKEADPKTISINGKGYGHRIGMSQYGADAFAKQGWSYSKILTHYYKGTVVGPK
ncbi:SpoIID/LytB domain-containing protein [Fictibacillus iocasae]|uniref:SpoIID/LytB domain-containing protein n=1 Tax=Fictibacillus iocasae TaxID=2715437 RepID=A0ABW2NRH1_9BACL